MTIRAGIVYVLFFCTFSEILLYILASPGLVTGSPQAARIN
jgi:hypothetical protein